MPRSHSVQEIVAAAVAAVGALILARKLSPGHRLDMLLNGNLRLFRGGAERRWLNSIAGSRRRYMLAGWPRPGVRDGVKRALLRAAAAGAADAEATRLALLEAPAPPRRPHAIEAHGDARVDDLYWLRDDARSSPDVLAHLAAEAAYTAAALADTEALQRELYTEMRGRVREADVSAPLRCGGWLYYTRTVEGGEYRAHCRRALPAAAAAAPHAEGDAAAYDVAGAGAAAGGAGPPAGPEQVMLDENREARGKAFYMVSGAAVSPDHALLAYGEDTVGGEQYALRVKHLATGRQLLARPVPGTAGDYAWAADSRTLFYTTKDHLDRPHKVWRLEVLPAAGGGAQAPNQRRGKHPEGELVYHERDEAFYVGVGLSRSERVLYIHSGSAVTSDVRWLDARTPRGEWRPVLPRAPEVEYDVADRGDDFFVTLRDGARPNSELLLLRGAAAPGGGGGAPPLVLLPHRPDVKLEHVEVSARHLAAFERAGGLQRAVVHALPPGGAPPAGPLGDGRAVGVDAPAYSLSPGAQGDFDSGVLRFHYSSLATPATTFDLGMDSMRRVAAKVQPVLGGFDAAAYRTERLWARAPDGVQVPISLVYRADLCALDGSDPLLLDAYGAYEACNDADFRSPRLSLVDRGFLFAIAHVRGGGEMGRAWYEDGKYLKKRNTFTDLVAAAEHLVARRLTSPARLCVEGRSAGGLTVAAALNARPELFAAAVLGVPFVDVLTTMLDETIPLTVIEWEEWGNPKASKEYYDYMKGYSPVDNVRPAARYPHVLATAGLHDPRVGYWEPAKWVAAVRAANAAAAAAAGRPGRGLPRMALLKCDTGAGHFSKSGRFDRLRETAAEYAFLLKTQGMVSSRALPSDGSAPATPAGLTPRGAPTPRGGAAPPQGAPPR